MAVRRIDWEGVSIHYRAGVRSLRDIGEEFGVSEGAIRKRAKKEEWPRDLSKKIKEKAAEKVRIGAVRNGTQGQSENEQIEAEAEIQSRIQLSHRKDIPQKRELVAKLFAEIEAQTDGKEVYEQLVLALGQGNQEGLGKVANKIISLPSRIKGVSDLVNAYKSLISLERQAFGIDREIFNDKDPLSQVLEIVAERRNPLVGDQ